MPQKRIPTPSQDAGNWGTILNDHLAQTQNPLNGAFNSFDQFFSRPNNLTADDAGRTYLYTQTGNWHEWSGGEWKVQNKSEINVKDYGAVGDGVADDTVIIDKCLLLLTSGKIKKLVFPTASYKFNVIISLGIDLKKKFIIDGQGSTIVGELKVQGCQCLTLENFANITAGVFIAGLWQSKINNITTDSSFKLTSGWAGGPNYWGSYWNVFENINCAGIIVNSQAFSTLSPGVNGNQFTNITSFKAVSNGTNGWDDTKKAGLRVIGDVQNLTFINSDFSYNDYGIVNESKSNVQLTSSYLEGIAVDGFVGGVNMLYSELSDDGTKNTNFNFDGKSQLFMSDSASSRVGSLLQTGSSVFFNSDLQYINKDGIPLGFVQGDFNLVKMELVTDNTGNNPFGRALKISNPFAEQRSVAIPFDSPTTGYISYVLICKGKPALAFITNYDARQGGDYTYNPVIGQSSAIEFRTLNGKLGGSLPLTKGMKCALEFYLQPGEELYISRISISPGQVASFISPPPIKQIGYDSTFPNLPNNSWVKADIIYNTNPVASSFVGWICTASGTPGTWKGFGLIEN